MVETLKTSAGVAFVATYQSLAAVAFTPENILLGDYAFVPYVRNGLSAAIGQNPAGNRVTIRAEVEVADSSDATTSQKIARHLTLYGPGDVIGIDPGQIIRREPVNGAVDAEQGYLAHIEFGRPDFPWMFSPLPATGDICQPWLALVICEAAVSHLEPSQGERPAQI